MILTCIPYWPSMSNSLKCEPAPTSYRADSGFEWSKALPCLILQVRALSPSAAHALNVYIMNSAWDVGSSNFGSLSVKDPLPACQNRRSMVLRSSVQNKLNRANSTFTRLMSSSFPHNFHSLGNYPHKAMLCCAHMARFYNGEILFPAVRVAPARRATAL